MKKWIVEISVYPSSYEIEAQSAEQAREIAKEKHYEEGGKSVYESVAQEIN